MFKFLQEEKELTRDSARTRRRTTTKNRELPKPGVLNFVPSQPNSPTPAPAPKVEGEQLHRPLDDRQVAKALKPVDGFLDVAPDSAMRPVNWRWQQALRIDLGVPIPMRWRDEWIAKALAFVRALKACKNATDQLNLFDTMPDLVAAFKVYSEEKSRARWTVEARLLSGEKLDVIADKMALPKEAIIWYERLFFNVLDLMKARMYIYCQAIKFHGDPKPDLGTIWKWFAFRGGPFVLDFIMGCPEDIIQAESPEYVRPFLNGDIEMTTLAKICIAAHTIPITETVAYRYARLGLELYQHHAKSNGKLGKDVDREKLSAGIKAMCDSLPWNQVEAAKPPKEPAS